MTIAEMHQEFKISYDIVDSAAYPELLDAEIDYYLNEAQDRFVKTRYGRNNIYGDGFEESQKRIDDLKTLVKSKFVNVTTVAHYGAIGEEVYRADVDVLFDDEARLVQSNDVYQFYLKASAQICDDGTLTCCDWRRPKQIQQDDLASIAGDPFNKPLNERPIIFFEDGDIFVWTEQGGVVNNVLVTFIKRPLKVDLGTYGNPVQNCELSEYTHKEIVQMAVDIVIENLQSPRVQTNEENVQKLE